MKKTSKTFTFIMVILIVSMLSACSFAAERENNAPFPAAEEWVEENRTYENIEDTVSTEKENLAEAPKQEETEKEQETTDTFARIDILLRAKVGGLNVRSEPKASAKSLGTLDKGDYVAFCGEQNGWYTTFYKEKRAYVSASFCDVVEIPQANERVEKVIDEGKKLLGYPYIWGSQRYHWGNGKLNGNFVSGQFDCSALMQYIFYKADSTLLGLTTREQVNQGQKIDRKNIQRGDLLFFTNSSRKNLSGVERVGHVALYLGGNLILHTASDYACIEEISNTRWSYYISASRM